MQAVRLQRTVDVLMDIFGQFGLQTSFGKTEVMVL